MNTPVAAFDRSPILTLTGEAGGVSPLVFASPHSGRLYPADMKARADLSIEALRSAEDALVDQLAAPGPEHGTPLLTGLIGRSYVDLNRAAGELDPALIDGAEGEGPRVAAGYGVLARLSGSGQPLYDRRLSLQEAERRLAAVHTPYHDALAGLMTAARERHGRALLIDWHSMPSRATTVRGPGRGADVVLGDRHGASAGREATRALARLFEAAGWRVALNHPYAGGYSTQVWGRREEGFEAVQVELNRALYLDEARLEPGPGFGRTKSVIARVIAGLAALDWPEAR